jgi:monovalent cation:H+ antiporter, CPA1 family
MAMVVAGLLIGNPGRSFAMSPTTVEHLDLFWKLIDEILNAVLFVFIGLEVLVLTFTTRYLVAGLLVVGIVLERRTHLPSMAIRFRPSPSLKASIQC